MHGNFSKVVGKAFWNENYMKKYMIADKALLSLFAIKTAYQGSQLAHQLTECEVWRKTSM